VLNREMPSSTSRNGRYGASRELQADCLPGAWTRSIEQQKLLQAVTWTRPSRDLHRLRRSGTDFTDPRAHGSGFQRVRAFDDGYEGGPRECLRLD
jgi:predicted metalloprotease